MLSVFQAMIYPILSPLIAGSLAGIISGRMLIAWQRKQEIRDKDMETLREVRGYLDKLKEYREGYPDRNHRYWLDKLHFLAHSLVSRECSSVRRGILTFSERPCSRNGLAKNAQTLLEKVEKMLRRWE